MPARTFTMDSARSLPLIGARPVVLEADALLVRLGRRFFTRVGLRLDQPAELLRALEAVVQSGAA